MVRCWIVNKRNEVIIIYTIIMDEHKQLVTTVSQTIYQRDNLVDELQFLFPQSYNSFDLSDFTVSMKYIDQANTPHVELLQKQSELYKDKLKYLLPVDTKLTRFAGDIEIRITFTKVDLETKKQYVLNTGSTIITVQPLKDYYAFTPDESLDFVDQLVGSLNAKIDAVNKIAETYDKEKADNLVYKENKLQLTSNGEKIGDAVEIVSGGDDNPGTSDNFDVVEF